MRLGISVGLAVLAMLLAPHAHADGLEAGLWRVVTAPEIGGVPGPPQQNMRCLSPDDVKDLEKTFSPIARTVNSPCEQIERDFTPQRLKWRLQCRGQIDMDVTGEFLFETPTRYTARLSTRASIGGQITQETRAVIEGQHVGECR